MGMRVYAEWRKFERECVKLSVSPETRAAMMAAFYGAFAIGLGLGEECDAADIAALRAECRAFSEQVRAAGRKTAGKGN